MAHSSANVHLLEERRGDRDGSMALICAIKRNDFDAVLHLLAYGANPHLADASGDTPLHHAVMVSLKVLLEFYLWGMVSNF